MKLAFWALAAAFAVAAAFHVAAIAVRSLDPSPVWRHALFVAINLGAAAGLVWRPRGFVVAFAALTAQQLWSHGALAVAAAREGRSDVASLVVVVVMPLALALLVVDARRRYIRRTA